MERARPVAPEWARCVGGGGQGGHLVEAAPLSCMRSRAMSCLMAASHRSILQSDLFFYFHCCLSVGEGQGIIAAPPSPKSSEAGRGAGGGPGAGMVQNGISSSVAGCV